MAVRSRSSKVPHILRDRSNPRKRLLLICQLFGVAPINKPMQKNRRHVRCTLVLLHWITTGVHIAWSIFILAMIALSYYGEYFRIIRNNIPIVRLLIFAEYSFKLLNCILIVVGANYQRSGYAEFERTIEVLDRRLWPTLGSRDDDELGRFLRAFYATVVIFCGCLITVFVGYQLDWLGMLIGISTYALPNVMVMLALAKYFCLMQLVQKRFERVVDELLALGGSGKDDAIRSATRTNSNMFVVEFNSVAHGGWQKKQKPIEHLNELRDVYHDMCRLAEKINGMFGCLIIGILLSAVFIITGQLYAIYHMKSTNRKDPLDYLCAGIWIMTDFTKVSMVLYWNARVMGAVSGSSFIILSIRMKNRISDFI